MSQASRSPRYFRAAAGGVAAIFFTPCHCWAADQAVLPWDYTLTVMQNFVAGPLAQSVIAISAIAAVLGFALAGDSEVTRRFAKAAIGTGIALIAVQLLNYLAP
jgi:type IV secretory pathway VirB2 component (pilin)